MVLYKGVSTIVGMIPRNIQIYSSILKKQNILKIILIIGYFLVTCNFLILFFHQPQGYVVDIYSELPIIFFLSLILCYTLGSAILFFSQGLIRKLGIVLLIFTYANLLLVPYLLGYYSMGRADDMSYIGEYLQISNSGNIAEWDIYPAIHIIGAIFSIGTGLAPHLVSFIIPFIFSFLFVEGLILCCRLFLKDQIFINIAIVSAFIFYLGPYNFLNVPHALFFASMPLFIYILFKMIKVPKFSNIILIFPFAFIIPFTHPFIVLFVISTLLAIILFGRILKKIIDMNYQQATIPLMIIIVGFLTWFMYCSTLLKQFSQSYLFYMKKATESVFFETTDKVYRANVDSYKIIKLLTLYYGRYAIPFLIISIAVIILYIKRDQFSRMLKNLMVFWAFFYIFFCFLELILFFNPIISHQPDRLTNLNFIVYAQVPLFVLSLYMIFMKPKSSTLKMVVLILILSSIWGLSLFGTFDSPNIFRTNAALTNNEVQGMKWFYESKTTENVYSPLSQIRRFHDLFADGGIDKNVFLSYHFGYVYDNRSFAEINLKTGEQSYIILMTVDELLYQIVPGYMEVGRYNAEDFRRFRNDNSLNKIFDDLNIEIYTGNRF